MRSLPAQFTTESKKKGAKAFFGFKLSGIQKYFSRAKQFDLDGNTYSDEIASIPVISTTSMLEGGIAPPTRVSFAINNEDLS